ncbi:hypothetical protein T12_16168 [Trichinella patagoniensis]|uniref:Uncharacterized protein n=1 Tax=Trichinella patagoniensis TaxID=990121 RepID=A0A0V0Z6D4_9BILA|nr:hypothetical protein T12_16168 [Trichinella patagoniensis]
MKVSDWQLFCALTSDMLGGTIQVFTDYMIKSDALHKQIAFYMPIDCHDLKTNGSKEWHNSHDMKLNTSYTGDENESELIIII